MVTLGTDSHKATHTFVAADEAGRQLGYQRLRNLRDRLRSRPSAPAPKKLGLASPQ